MASRALVVRNDDDGFTNTGGSLTEAVGSTRAHDRISQASHAPDTRGLSEGAVHGEQGLHLRAPIVADALDRQRFCAVSIDLFLVFGRNTLTSCEKDITNHAESSLACLLWSDGPAMTAEPTDKPAQRTPAGLVLFHPD